MKEAEQIQVLRPVLYGGDVADKKKVRCKKIKNVSPAIPHSQKK